MTPKVTAIRRRAVRARCALTITFVLTLTSCASPFLLFPGHRLKGIEKTTKSFAFASQFKILQLETRPDEPYSVILRVLVLDGNLYIDAAEKRHWSRNLLENRQVRVKLGGVIYRALAVPVDEASITDHFFSSRTVYRLDPVDR